MKLLDTSSSYLLGIEEFFYFPCILLIYIVHIKNVTKSQCRQNADSKKEKLLGLNSVEWLCYIPDAGLSLAAGVNWVKKTENRDSFSSYNSF